MNTTANQSEQIKGARYDYENQAWTIDGKYYVACGFQLAGMLPPCVLPVGHAGDHADGIGGYYSEAGFVIALPKSGKTVQA